MKRTERIQLLTKLGDHLRKNEDEFLKALMTRTQYNNHWFTLENQELAMKSIADQFLTETKLTKWLACYKNKDLKDSKRVGLVLAGNIPMVGFHDIICVFAAGHYAIIKLSSKDEYILPYLFKLLGQWDERANSYFTIVEKLEDFDAVIATGSNNSARYFQAYFGKYPHIIRKNRNAVAVLTGDESKEELHDLGKDIFRYFGLGCRNVAKIYVPKAYNFDPLLTALHEYRDIVLHTKYKNNFDYNYAMYMLNKEPFLANGCILLREDPVIASRIANLNYEFYEEVNLLEESLRQREEEIQCIIAKDGLLNLPSLGFGKAQEPGLADYADGVDTMAFLQQLS